MDIEYEVRILNVDVDEIKRRLDNIGAKFEWDRLQQRYVYDFIPRIPGKWIRLRTNGVDTTLTIKNLVSSRMDGTQELEVSVGDFNRTNLILKELGYEAKGYQENRRIQYKYNDVEIDIDYWPLIPTYVEIEGPSEEAIYKTVEALGFSKENCTSRDVEGLYLDYGYDLGTIYNLKLEEERK